jgi:magnesium transporter
MSDPTPETETDVPEADTDQTTSSDESFSLSTEFIRAVTGALEAEDAEQVRLRLVGLHAADLADLINLISSDQRRQLIELLGRDLDPEVLAELEESVRDEILALIDPRHLAAAVSELETDDAVYVLEDLEPHEQQEVLRAIPAQDRAAVEEGLAFAEDSAGRLMQRDFIAVAEYWTVGQTIDYMRESDDLPDEFYEIFVVDPAFRPVGTIPLNRAMRTKRPVMVRQIMNTEQKLIPVDMDQEEVAYMFSQYDLLSAAVVDQNGRLVGMITADDVMEVIEEEAEEDIMRLAGVGEVDLYDSVLNTTRTRFTWLLVNLGTAILASIVIALFDATIEQIVALAILMPIVASMGGNAGTQTLTVAVRSLAARELTPTNAYRVINKETLVGLVNGVLFAVLISIVAAVWFKDLALGGVLAAAMVINMVVAALSGILVPLGLDRIGIDPAVASSVFVTTITDVVGFFAFLGLAALLLL